MITVKPLKDLRLIFHSLNSNLLLEASSRVLIKAGVLFQIVTATENTQKYNKR